MTRSERGFTLAELLVASAVGTVVILAMTSIDVTRLMIQLDIRNNANGMASNEALAGLAGVRLAKDLERADRINMVNNNPDVIQLRIPIMTTAGCTGAGVIPASDCLNSAANFRWSEYRLSGGALEYFENVAGAPACAPPLVLVRQIAALNFDRKDRAQPPPGGELSPEDNNVVEYLITWADVIGNTHSFRGEVTSRAIAYTDLTVTGSDSGSGLLIPTVGVPPQCT